MEKLLKVPTTSSALKFLPVTAARWPDLEELFGKRGAYGGCWCMWWRLRRSEFARRTGQQNKRHMHRLVKGGDVPGLLAYVNREPVAWCSIAPREEYAGLEHARALKRVDDQPVWAVVCFFVAAAYRGRGIMVPLLRAAVDYAAKRGAKIVEGYPVVPGNRRLSGSDGFTGIASVFRRVGFVRVARRSQRRPIMRYRIRSE